MLCDPAGAVAGAVFWGLVKMRDARSALEALTGELTRLGSPLESKLKPGLPAGDVIANLRRVGALAHRDVVELYAWRDGFDPSRLPVSGEGFASLIPGHREFHPLAQSIGEYVAWLRRAQGEAAYVDPDTIWRRTWFPIFFGPGSEAIFISNQADDPGSVWWHPVQDEPYRLFTSLGAPMDEVTQALVDGRLRLDDVGAYTQESIASAGEVARL